MTQSRFRMAQQRIIFIDCLYLKLDLYDKNNLYTSN